MTEDEKSELIKRLTAAISDVIDSVDGAINRECGATLRLDTGEEVSTDIDPLTIDIYDAGNDTYETFYSLTVSDLVENMIVSDSSGPPDARQLSLPDDPDRFVLVRDELRRLADLIDEAISTRKEDDGA